MPKLWAQAVWIFRVLAAMSCPAGCEGQPRSTFPSCLPYLAAANLILASSCPITIQPAPSDLIRVHDMTSRICTHARKSVAWTVEKEWNCETDSQVPILVRSPRAEIFHCVRLQVHRRLQ
ncbi:hypothetical protein DL98DRAFT_184867 [Cadophora sp. DSE1049]|nr:hypothetical protein DL98DRAFT_184867 [Cadophora sp. DSE1049]